MIFRLAADKELGLFRRALPQFLAVGCKNLVLLGYGMTIGFPTIIIPAIQGGDARDASKGEFKLSDDQVSWLSSINLLCVPLGCFLSGMLTEPTGKRRAMQLVNVPMIVSWLLFYFSTNVNYLYTGLCLSGLSGGLMEAPVLTYVAEVTQPQFRGMLAATGTTCVITGIFVQFILGTFFSWREVALISCFLPLFTITALFFVPESPYWLLTKGRVEEAQHSLCWLRGWVPFSRVETEFNEIHRVLDEKRREVEAYREMPYYKRFEPFSKRGFIAPFILVSATFFVGHFSGKTPLQTYAVQIFNTLKAPIDKYYATIMLGGAELVGAFTCVLLVHSTGKRPLVFASLIGTGFCFFATATYAHFLDTVPGVSVDNVVANYSMENLDRSSFVDQRNLTAAFSNLTDFENVMHFEMTTEFLTTYDDGTQTTTDSILETTARYKRANVVESPSGSNMTVGDESNIILHIPNAKENKYLWLPLTLLIAGAVLSHLGIRIIPWMLIGEVFPVNVRSAASGLSSGLGYIFAFLANKLFLSMLATLTLSGTFWFYSAVAFIGCIIFYFTLPETEGRTLLEIEEHFLGKRYLSEKKPKSDGLENGVTNHGFDIVTVVPQTVIKSPALQPNGHDSNDNNSLKVNGNQNEHRLSIPEIFITLDRQPGAGSKRYKHRVTDTIRSRNSINSNEEDVQDTRL
ncbi:facilitated trehalose transporter Tret1 isoform X2 [Sitodiplosis mosellana]|uniref:facilitated trehalose transporter Tret1 isoform X2 n=1 Tax=Sitodiplosis mosellana TaxID=263140 RepID=UPI00244539D2|nr:facilitated trehalose transporter Tret1 isoform X2 [Sitodiplosis mosellana]